MNSIHYQAEQQRFSLMQNGREAGYLTYRKNGDAWNIDHTVVSPEYRGQGLARLLVDAAITEAEKQNIRLSASCSYAADILAG